MEVKRIEDNINNTLHFSVEGMKVMEVATIQVALENLLSIWESQRDLPDNKKDYENEQDIERLKGIIEAFKVKNVK